jgi:hypothetical protein
MKIVLMIGLVSGIFITVVTMIIVFILKRDSSVDDNIIQLEEVKESKEGEKEKDEKRKSHSDVTQDTNETNISLQSSSS